MGRKRYDWSSIRQEYISTDISAKQLAKKHGIRYPTLSQRSADEGWVQARKDFKSKVSEQMCEQVCENIAEDKAKGLSNLFIAANNFSQVILEYSERMLNGSLPIKGSELAHLHECMKIEEELIRSIGHIPTELQKHKMEIEQARLKMDQQKAEAFNPDSKIVVQIEGFEEEWAE